MIDSHCHLGIDDYKDDIDAILLRAKQSGVDKILTVACHYNQLDDLKKMMAIKDVYGAFGIHPECAIDFDENKTIQIFKENSEIIALGEIGLDYFYNPDTKQAQINAFQKQIEIADLFKKPIIIHTRSADEETIEILNQQKKYLNNGGVLHCFSGSECLAKAGLDLGLYFSASGIITFKKAQELRDIFKAIPLERLLIETDAPYLAPVPYRGHTNEPAYVIKTLEMLAEIKNIDIKELENITTQNFNNLFKIKVKK